jgi:pilus assembly protein CpaB
MGRAKGWIWLSLALVCALSAGGLTYFLLQQQSAAAELALAEARTFAPPEIETAAIPVAARDLERGQLITPQDFELKAFPVDLVPSSAIADPAELEGQILAEHVSVGDIFRSSSLYGGTGAPLSSEIASGRTVIAFPVMDLFTGTGLFVEGDRVDLLLSVGVEAEQDGQAVDAGEITGYTVQNVRVMHILRPRPTTEEPNPPPTALLLELDPSDAVMVKKVKDAGGTVDLALRSPVDSEAFDVGPVTDTDLIRLMSGDGGSDIVGNTP